MTVENIAAAQPTDRKLLITRIFEAPRSLVFKAWTEPERLMRWWGPRGFTMTVCKMDLRRGGAYRFEMRSPEGTEHRSAGVFQDVVEPERLVLSGAWVDAEGKPGHETVLTLTFADHDGKTMLTLHQAVFESVTARDSHHGGWSSSMDCLGEYLATA